MEKKKMAIIAVMMAFLIGVLYLTYTSNLENAQWEEPETENQESAYAVVETKEQGISYDLDYLLNIVNQDSIEILKEEVEKMIPEAEKVQCLPYMKTSEKDMNVIFYLQVDEQEIWEAAYSLQFAKYTVKKSDLTRKNVEDLIIQASTEKVNAD